MKEHEHSPLPPPFCDICVIEIARLHGLTLVYKAGSAIDNDGERVYWINGDYVDPELLRREAAETAAKADER